MEEQRAGRTENIRKKDNTKKIYIYTKTNVKIEKQAKANPLYKQMWNQAKHWTLLWSQTSQYTQAHTYMYVYMGVCVCILRCGTAVRTLRSFFIRKNVRLTLLESGEHICPWTAIIVIVIGIEQD